MMNARWAAIGDTCPPAPHEQPQSVLAARLGIGADSEPETLGVQRLPGLLPSAISSTREPASLSGNLAVALAILPGRLRRLLVDEHAPVLGTAACKSKATISCAR
jgi:hypothetical protein